MVTKIEFAVMTIKNRLHLRQRVELFVAGSLSESTWLGNKNNVFVFMCLTADCHLGRRQKETVSAKDQVASTLYPDKDFGYVLRLALWFAWSATTEHVIHATHL